MADLLREILGAFDSTRIEREIPEDHPLYILSDQIVKLELDSIHTVTEEIERKLGDRLAWKTLHRAMIMPSSSHLFFLPLPISVDLFPVSENAVKVAVLAASRKAEGEDADLPRAGAQRKEAISFLFSGSGAEIFDEQTLIPRVLVKEKGSGLNFIQAFIGRN